MMSFTDRELWLIHYALQRLDIRPAFYKDDVTRERNEVSALTKKVHTVRSRRAKERARS